MALNNVFRGSPLRSIFVLLLTLAFSAFPLLSQGQRGKISGTVTDAQTGEALIGANVVVRGTAYGGSTDFDGKFVILNVPPGRFTVSISMIGYGAVSIRDVEVFIDRTTEVNAQLREATIQVAEVTVTAQRPKVVKDQTSTAQTIDDRAIRQAPTEGIRGALDLSASFQRTEQGGYQVRGSGSYEVNFQINGVEQINSATTAPGAFGTDKANNSWKYDVNPLGVQQVQLITGGFSAEYGNAQAGVVKVVTKEGGPKLTGEVRVEYRPPGQYHWGPYLYDQNNYEWRMWGDVSNWLAQRKSIAEQLLLNVRYKDLYDRYYNGTASGADSSQWLDITNREISWAHSVWVDNHTPRDDHPLGVYDYRNGAYTRYLIGIGGPLGKDPNLLKFYFSGEYRSNPTRLPTPERNLVYQNYLLNVISTPVKDHKFKLMGMYQNYRGGIWSGSDDIRWSGIAFSPPGISTKYTIAIDPVRTEETMTQSLNWVHTINQFSFIEATFTHQSERYELPYVTLPAYDQQADRLDSLYDPRGVLLRPGRWYENAYFREPFNFSTNYYQDNRTEQVSFAVDYTNQVTREHLIKAGARFFYWDMVNNGVNSSYRASSFLTHSGFAEYYRAFPWNAAAYIQDKMEFSGLIANIGVRVESYNFGASIPVDAYNVFYQGAQGPPSIGDPATTPSKTKFILLPRVGVSFPIGENTAFRIQYGHFSSMPVFSQAFSVRTESGWIGRGNPDLDFKKTINYEFGLQQVVKDDYRFDVALYYNDRVSQVGSQSIAAYTGSRNRPAGKTLDNVDLYRYSTYANNAFGSTIGMEATFENVDVSNWKYRLSYNLSQTTVGNYGPSILYPDNTRGYSQRNFTGEFLSGSDRTHVFRGLLLYSFNEGEGFEILGVTPLENTNVSLTYTAQSGIPFTYVTEFGVQDVVNNRRYPLESQTDFNATKTIRAGTYMLLVGVRIMNLFNNRWLTPIDTQDDRNNWVEQGITIDNPGTDPLRLSYVVAPYRAYRNIPRQIFFTVGVGF